MSTLITYVALVAAIILIGRFFGNPKLGNNLLLVLVASVVLGLGMKSFKEVVITPSKNYTEKITNVDTPMQLQSANGYVTIAQSDPQGIAGQAITSTFIIKDAIIGEQLLLPNPTKNKDPCIRNSVIIDDPLCRVPYINDS